MSKEPLGVKSPEHYEKVKNGPQHPTLIDECRELLNEYSAALQVIQRAQRTVVRDPTLSIQPLSRLVRAEKQITERYAEELAAILIVEPERERNGRQG